jgi:DNA-binding NarL/FixJ family response regulator
MFFWPMWISRVVAHAHDVSQGRNLNNECNKQPLDPSIRLNTDLAARPQGAVIDDADEAMDAAAIARVAADEALARGDADAAVTLLEEALEHVVTAMKLANDDPPAPPSGDLASLTPRELEVIRLVARGMTNAEIAAELVISPRTAQSHVASALKKSGTRRRTELAALAIREGIATP